MCENQCIWGMVLEVQLTGHADLRGKEEGSRNYLDLWLDYSSGESRMDRLMGEWTGWLRAPGCWCGEITVYVDQTRTAMFQK